MRSVFLLSLAMLACRVDKPTPVSVPTEAVSVASTPPGPEASAQAPAPRSFLTSITLKGGQLAFGEAEGPLTVIAPSLLLVREGERWSHEPLAGIDLSIARPTTRLSIHGRWPAAAFLRMFQAGDGGNGEARIYRRADAGWKLVRREARRDEHFEARPWTNDRVLAARSTNGGLDAGGPLAFEILAGRTAPVPKLKQPKRERKDGTRTDGFVTLPSGRIALVHTAVGLGFQGTPASTVESWEPNSVESTIRELPQTANRRPLDFHILSSGEDVYVVGGIQDEPPEKGKPTSHGYIAVAKAGGPFEVWSAPGDRWIDHAIVFEDALWVVADHLVFRREPTGTWKQEPLPASSPKSTSLDPAFAVFDKTLWLIGSCAREYECSTVLEYGRGERTPLVIDAANLPVVIERLHLHERYDPLTPFATAPSMASANCPSPFLLLDVPEKGAPLTRPELSAGKIDPKDVIEITNGNRRYAGTRAVSAATSIDAAAALRAAGMRYARALCTK